MGALGSGAATQAADIVLMDDQPSIIAQAVVLVLGACGIANMWLAVFADVGVSVIAILNAMRALK